MADPFTILPAPLILMILKLVADLPTLRHLIQASPAAAGTFQECYCEIIEAVISSSLHPQVQQLVRTIARLPSDFPNIANHPSSLQEFDSYLASYLSGDASATSLTRSSTTFPAVRSLLDVACQVHNLTKSFFEAYLKRVNTITPSHLLDPRFRFSKNPSMDHPKGRRYQPAECGPPSWIEEHRVYRALWRLQIYFSLVQYCIYDSSLSDEVRVVLQGDSPHYIWANLPPWELDEIDCLSEHLNDIQASTGTLAEDIEHPSALPIGQDSYVAWISQPVPQDFETDYLWGQCTEAFPHSSLGYNWFHGSVHHMSTSPLRGSSFEPFRRLGFGIWDLKKMAKLEMLNIPSKLDPPLDDKIGYVPGVDKRLTHDDLMFTWASLTA